MEDFDQKLFKINNWIQIVPQHHEGDEADVKGRFERFYCQYTSTLCGDSGDGESRDISNFELARIFQQKPIPFIEMNLNSVKVIQDDTSHFCDGLQMIVRDLSEPEPVSICLRDIVPGQNTGWYTDAVTGQLLHPFRVDVQAGIWTYVSWSSNSDGGGYQFGQKNLMVPDALIKGYEFFQTVGHSVCVNKHRNDRNDEKFNDTWTLTNVQLGPKHIQLHLIKMFEERFQEPTTLEYIRIQLKREKITPFFLWEIVHSMSPRMRNFITRQHTNPYVYMRIRPQNLYCACTQFE